MITALRRILGLLASDDLADFCGLNASDSVWDNVFIPGTSSLNHCAELGAISLEQIIFVFLIVVNLVESSTSRQIPSRTIRSIIGIKLLTSLATSLFLLASIVLSYATKYGLPTAIVIEYSILAFGYALYASVWLCALCYNTWWRPFWLSGLYGFVTKSFFLIAWQRYGFYGLTDPRVYSLLIILAIHALGSIGLFVEWRHAKQEEQLLAAEDENEDDPTIAPQSLKSDESASYLSRLFFCWVNPLVSRGYRGGIHDIGDLFRLPPSLRVQNVERKLVESASSFYTDGTHFSLPSALFSAFGTGYMALGIVRLLGDLLSFAGPILLNLLVTDLQEGDAHYYGFILASIMLLTSFFAALFDFNFNFYVNKVSLQVRCATITALYDKLLQVPVCRLSKFSSGQLINFMSSDVDNVVNFCNSFHTLWSLVFKLIIAMYLLYREVGLAILSVVLASVVIVPLNMYVSFKVGDMTQKMLAFKDQRMRLVTETMRAIRIVKLSNWEPFFEDRINRLRDQELKYLAVRKYLDAFCVYMWVAAPVLITVAILTTYTLWLQETLTPAKVFTSMALINMLISPLNALPWVMLGLIQAIVSTKRYRKFFALRDIDMHGLYAQVEQRDRLLDIQQTSFHWTPSSHSLKDISLVGDAGTIVGVIGPVGAGKTTLLYGILGETEVEGSDSVSYLEYGPIKIPQRCINDGFSFVGHDCWLRRGTIRENILLGRPYIAELYKDVIHMTALDYDINKMPSGDSYVIGDDGTTLSGGQRARLALARAIYHDSDIILLDDVFASLDAKVANFIWTTAIEGFLKQRGKLVIVATHHVEYLTQADVLVLLGTDGRITSFGGPDEILPVLEKGVLSGPASHAATDESLSTGVDESLEEDLGTIPLIVSEEARQQGTVKFGVYWSYIRATGYYLSAGIIFSLIAMQASKNLSEAWLSKWTVSNMENGTDGYRMDLQDDNFVHWVGDTIGEVGHTAVYGGMGKESWEKTKKFLLIYLILGGVNTIFTLIRAFLFAYGGINSAKRLHSDLLTTVLSSSISWWDQTPWGRVVNRLCADVYTVDDSLPFQLNICLASLVNLFGSLILTSFALPLIIPMIGVLFVLYYLVQRYYRFTTCEVKRLSSVTLSPLYSHITDSVTGVVTIRAHRLVEQFTQILHERLEANLTALYSANAASLWLSVRLQLLGVFMLCAIAFMSVIEIRFKYVESGLVGLAITYALSMNGLLSGLLSSFVETEKELVAVERIVDYVEDTPQEDSDEQIAEIDRSVRCRIINGHITFNGVSLRYSPRLPWALKDTSFHIEAGQRVAIIGRTGAGKSSIFQALLRSHDIERGKIFIDNHIDISALDLKAVRSIFGIVAQAPFIFSGSVRENFAMDRQVSDAEIIDVVHAAGLGEWLTRVGGLDAEVVESGSNFSFGEKQIICFCRLILSKPKIVLIDEATAHLDEATHLVLNRLLRQTLPTTTVVAIMHRLADLEFFDLVIEMANGSVKKIGPPNDFLTSAAAILDEAPSAPGPK